MPRQRTSRLHNRHPSIVIITTIAITPNPLLTAAALLAMACGHQVSTGLGFHLCIILTALALPMLAFHNIATNTATTLPHSLHLHLP